MKISDYELVYKTSITPVFPIYLMAAQYTKRFERHAKISYEPKPVVLVVSDGTVSFFFHKDFKIAARQIFENAFKNPKAYVEKLQKNEKKISRMLLEEIKTPVEELFDGRNLNKKGKIKLQNIFKNYSVYADYLDVPGFIFQIYVVDDFKKRFLKEFSKKTIQEKETMFSLLLSSDYLTNYEQFRRELLLSFDKEPAYRKIAQKYFWVVHDYVGDIIDEKYIKGMIQESDLPELKKELHDSRVRIQKINEVKKLLPIKLKREFNLISALLYLYNDRKKQVCNRVNIYIRKIFECKYPGISTAKLRKFYQLTKDEIIKVLAGENKYDIERVNKKWAYFILNEKITKAPEEYFKLIEVSKNIKELKGIPASSGKAVGTVDIILNISHIFKFKKDDILVAPFTNVNYLPIMGKAKAILTESGGLTSHAAIVSRELKKPCIVGIKNLISALKDGDEVEVDADKGVVKIIK